MESNLSIICLRDHAFLGVVSRKSVPISGPQRFSSICHIVLGFVFCSVIPLEVIFVIMHSVNWSSFFPHQLHIQLFLHHLLKRPHFSTGKISTEFSPLNRLCTSVKNQLSVYVCVGLILGSVLSPPSVSVVTPTPCHLICSQCLPLWPALSLDSLLPSWPSECPAQCLWITRCGFRGWLGWEGTVPSLDWLWVHFQILWVRFPKLG